MPLERCASSKMAATAARSAFAGHQAAAHSGHVPNWGVEEMIKTVADLMKAFADEERKKLDIQKIAHAPTIGAMYEGLSREILTRTIPENLGLQVVKGFAYFDDKQSGQLDCMLVHGSGEKIPYTDDYRWHVKDVIGVLEVKKTLTESELSDSYTHLHDVYDLYLQCLKDGKVGGSVDLSWPRRVFSQITGIAAPDHDTVDDELPFDLQNIYHTLVMEFISPVRIVVGHHGWKKESTLREHITKYVEGQISNPLGMGVNSFPHQIIGGEFSLVKANGFPYTTTLVDGKWPFLLSTRHNFVRIMLELLFSKIDALFGTELAFDNSIEQEAMASCLRGRAIKKDDKAGWEYTFDNITEKALKTRGHTYEWRPAQLTLAQHVIITQLCNKSKVDMTDKSFVEFAEKEPGGIAGFIQSLIDTRLVAKKGNHLVLTTVNCLGLIGPDGNFYAAENNTGQLMKWLEGIVGKPEDEWKTLVIKTG